MKIAILGAGNVGGAIGAGWARAGHTIAFGVRDPADGKHAGVAAAAGGAAVQPIAQAVAGAEAIVLATPFGAIDAALAACGPLAGRVLIDVTNPLRMGAGGLELSMGFDTSGGEMVAAKAPGAFVFKTLNQVGFEVMANTDGFPTPPVMFIAGDSTAHLPLVETLIADLGFEAVYAGALSVSRLLEPFGTLWIHMAINRKGSRQRAFALPARAAKDGAQA